MIADPAVELGADQVEVLRRCAALALADALGVLAAQPRLDAVGVLVLAELAEGLDALLPDTARARAPVGVADIREQVTLEHVGGRERQPAVVHGLEDRVGVAIGVGRDLDQVDVLHQPVHEVRQRRALELVREQVFDVAVAGEDVGDGL